MKEFNLVISSTWVTEPCLLVGETVLKENFVLAVFNCAYKSLILDQFTLLPVLGILSP